MRHKLHDVLDAIVILCAIISFFAWFLTGLEQDTVEEKIKKIIVRQEQQDRELKEQKAILGHYFLNDD